MKENDKSELLRETLLSTAIFFHNLFLFHLLYSRVQTCSLFPMVGGPVNRGYICSWANNRVFVRPLIA